MAEIIRPPKFGGLGDGDGPEGPMLEARVARLEEDMKDVKVVLRTIELAVAEIKHLPKAADYAGLKAEIAELKGRLSQVPTILQLTAVVITTWSAGAAMVFTLLRLARP